MADLSSLIKEKRGQLILLYATLENLKDINTESGAKIVYNSANRYPRDAQG